jgi:heat-inducible transcriptional repressor
MDPPYLDQKTKQMVDVNFGSSTSETEDLLKVTSSILSSLTNQLAMVTYPKFEQATLEKIQIVQLSSTRLLVIVSVKSGMIRTITLEIDANVREEQINIVQQYLNEKLLGLRFSEIRDTFQDRIKDINTDSYRPIIRVFLESIDKIFTDVSSEKAIIVGTNNILKQPEFVDHENFQSVIELVENKDIIIHFLNKNKSLLEDEVIITIGGENPDEKLSDYSVITKEYKIGDLKGTLGIMGPTRMDYSKIVAAVVYVAEQLTQELTKQR